MTPDEEYQNKKVQIEMDNDEITAEFVMFHKLIDTYEQVYSKQANTYQELSNIKSDENKNLLTEIDNNKKIKYTNFLSKQLFRYHKLLIVFLIISLSPILSIYIIVFIYYLIDKIKFIVSNKLPKNAYVSL